MYNLAKMMFDHSLELFIEANGGANKGTEHVKAVYGNVCQYYILIYSHIDLSRMVL